MFLFYCPYKLAALNDFANYILILAMEGRRLMFKVDKIRFEVISKFNFFPASLTDVIINQHSSLRGIAQQLAEVYYIVGAQQLDGYGQECFLAKDERGSEVLIGASLTG